MALTPKRLVLDLLSACPVETVPVSALIRAGSLFQFSANLMRVTLTRLRAANLVATTRRGQYVLGGDAADVQRHVAGWRRLEERVTSTWEPGSYVGVHTGGLPRADRSNLRRRQRGLALFGFRSVSVGLEIRPDNLALGIDELAHQLRGFGVASQAPVFRITGMDPQTSERARTLWDVAALEERYEQLAARTRSSLERLASLEHGAAVRESFLVGGDVLRALAFDPLLPAPIVERRKRRDLVEVMVEYDQVGRRLWREYLVEGESRRAA